MFTQRSVRTVGGNRPRAKCSDLFEDSLSGGQERKIAGAAIVRVLAQMGDALGVRRTIVCLTSAKLLEVVIEPSET